MNESMKMAKASDEEWEKLVAWFNSREANNEEVPQWRRVVFGFRVLVDNTCDEKKTYLDWKPEVLPYGRMQIDELRDLLRYVVFQRLPLGDTVFDHLDFQRQQAVNEALEPAGGNAPK